MTDMVFLVLAVQAMFFYDGAKLAKGLINVAVFDFALDSIQNPKG